MANRQLLKLRPECFVLLVIASFFGGLGIVFDEPGEVFGVVDFVAEHLFAAGSVKWQLVSFRWISVQANFQKRYKLKISDY